MSDEKNVYHWVVEQVRPDRTIVHRWYAGTMSTAPEHATEQAGVLRKYRDSKYNDYFFKTHEEAMKFINGK